MEPSGASRTGCDPQSKTLPDGEERLLSSSPNQGLGEQEIPDNGTFPPPAASSQDPPPPAPSRTLTFANGLAIVISIQIGSGIFSSPSAIYASVGSPTVSLLIWLFAGFLAWTGAASFIELGSTVPLNGGVQEYLRFCYNDACGFLAAWTWVLVVKPCAVAMIALTGAEYLLRAVARVEKDDVDVWTLRGTAILAVVVITYFNCRGTRIGAEMANVFFVLKLVGLGSIIVTGFALRIIRFQRKEDAPRTPEEVDEIMDQSFWGYLGAYTDGTLAALWAYSGWEVLGLIAGELKNPYQNLPRIINSAMAIVITLFILANDAYFVALPLDLLSKTNTIALDFGRTVFGPAGSVFYAWVVCLSCLGALNAKIFTAGRLTEMAAERRYLPSSFLVTSHNLPRVALLGEDIDRNPSAFSMWRKVLLPKKENKSVPIKAMLLNLCLAVIYLLLGTFRSLLIFVGMAESIMLFAAVAGVLVLRRRARNIDPISLGYRTHVLNPIIYCVVSAVVVVRSVVRHPGQGVVIFIFNSVGLGVYRFKKW